MENQALAETVAASTLSTSVDKSHVKCPAPAGCTPPMPHAAPSPAECTDASGSKFHPPTPYPETTIFSHNPHLIPTLTAQESSPVLCGPTPASTPVHPSSSYPHSPTPSNIEFASETYHVTPGNNSTLFPGSTAHPTHPSTIKGN